MASALKQMLIVNTRNDGALRCEPDADVNPDNEDESSDPDGNGQ